MALQKLFGNQEIAFSLLGQDIPLSQRDIKISVGDDPNKRARALCKKIESFIVQLANELDELGDDENPRLRAEATAMLVALREIQTHFPDAIGVETET